AGSGRGGGGRRAVRGRCCQVRRDHLISHLLAALSVSLVDELVFFGALRWPGAWCRMVGCRRTSTCWRSVGGVMWSVSWSVSLSTGLGGNIQVCGGSRR
ncbi:MAG: hypothetical protein ACRDSH_18375, partial [Pseudonocardiaceae bacterium]